MCAGKISHGERELINDCINLTGASPFEFGNDEVVPNELTFVTEVVEVGQCGYFRVLNV